MMRSFRVMFCLLAASLAPALTAPAVAQEEPACTTQAECDYRADIRATRERQAAYKKMIQQQDDWAAERARLTAQDKIDANNGRISRAQEIMRRRRAAAAAAGKN